MYVMGVCTQRRGNAQTADTLQNRKKCIFLLLLSMSIYTIQCIKVQLTRSTDAHGMYIYYHVFKTKIGFDDV